MTSPYYQCTPLLPAGSLRRRVGGPDLPQRVPVAAQDPARVLQAALRRRGARGAEPPRQRGQGPAQADLHQAGHRLQPGHREAGAAREGNCIRQNR